MLKHHRPYAAIALSMLLALAPAIAALPPADFSLRSLDGGTVSARSLRGKVVVLAFGASWLPLSRAQARDIQKVADNYSGRGVEVYWVSTEAETPKSKNYASDDQLRAFAQKNGLKVTVLRDPEGAALRALNVDQIPAVVILDRQGNIAGAPIGGLDEKDNLADQIAARLNGLL